MATIHANNPREAICAWEQIGYGLPMTIASIRGRGGGDPRHRPANRLDQA
jgi:hypothetical protein